jgi:hypothetical protein
MHHVTPAHLARVVAVLVCLGAGSMSAGCSREALLPRVAGTPDSLASGVPAALVPKLTDWVQVWRAAIPDFVLDSLRLADSSASFELRYFGPGSSWPSGAVRDRAGIRVVSPDSARAVDFDIYLELYRDAGGGFDYGREPDSAPVLANFVSDSLWQVAFCGTPCFFDGATWLDADRFVLTGAMRSGAMADGPWCGFLDIYDLKLQRMSSWRTDVVNDGAFGRYVAAWGSMMTARLQRVPS